MSRIDQALAHGSERKLTMVNGTLESAELDRLNSAWRPAGYSSRSEFIRDSILDAVEKVETNLGGAQTLLAAEAQRQAAKAAKVKSAQQ
jgi:metal-responsive CopG/Arc/MetJ family transcriptional regulator